MITGSAAAPGLTIAGRAEYLPPGTGGIDKPAHQQGNKNAEPDKMRSAFFINLHHNYWHKGYFHFRTSVFFQKSGYGTIV